MSVRLAVGKMDKKGMDLKIIVEINSIWINKKNYGIMLNIQEITIN